MISNNALVNHLRNEGILFDEDVERAMRRVDRIAFVDPRYAGQAYEDRALPNSFGQFISAPHMVALMAQYLSIMPGMKILEIGSDSGYLAAVLSELVGPEGKVYTIKHLPALADRVKNKLLPYTNITVYVGNSVLGLRQHAPFDRIIVSAAVHTVPETLMDQLAEGGRMILPLGRGAAQRLTLIEKIGGKPKKTDLQHTCMFVPLVD